MAENILSRKQSPWMSVSSLPSMNLTPMAGMVPVPYNVVSDMSGARGASGNVKANAAQVHKDDKTIMPTTKGDEPGSGKGVASGTVGQQSWNAQKSSNVQVNDQKVVRNDDKTDMEGDKKAKEDEEAKKRQECREEQVKAGQQSADPAVRAAAERFSQNITAAQMAKLSTDVYSPVPGGPPGWINESNNPEYLAAHGLDRNHLTGPGAYQAQIYRPDPAVYGDNPRFGPTVAFRGTTSLINSDMGANIGQATGYGSEYYSRAEAIGNVTRPGTDRAVTYTGHSLGGGLASAASQRSGGPAYTFNAAGLNRSTIYRPSGNGSQIQAYRVDGEVLTGGQEPGWRTALVSPAAAIAGRLFSPKAAGIPHELPATSLDPVSRHSLTDVTKGIESQKDEDQKKIAKDTGKKC
jgi:Domain of unknown function (DUF4150)